MFNLSMGYPANDSSSACFHFPGASEQHRISKSFWRSFIRPKARNHFVKFIQLLFHIKKSAYRRCCYIYEGIPKPVIVDHSYNESS